LPGSDGFNRNGTKDAKEWERAAGAYRCNHHVTCSPALKAFQKARKSMIYGLFLLPVAVQIVSFCVTKLHLLGGIKWGTGLDGTSKFG